MLTATATTVERLRYTPESPRSREMFAALDRAGGEQGVDVRVTDAYAGGSDLLLLWGPGAPNRFGPMREQQAMGGHVLAWDLAYWSRESKLRVSIDGAHPQAYVMRRDLPRDRFLADGVRVDNVWDPSGPVIIAGIGRKARVQYGEATVLAWEAEMLAACEARWPVRQVLYRRKQDDAPIPDGARLASSAPIEDVLTGASLVITWHSNVAVDAIRMGVPVICRDGAAAAVCPSTLGGIDPGPLPVGLRDRFLANLAWFQWAPHEAAACWAFLREALA